MPPACKVTTDASFAARPSKERIATVYANPLLATLKHRTEVTLKSRMLATSCAQAAIANRTKIGLHKPVHNVVSAKRADTGGSCSIFSEFFFLRKSREDHPFPSKRHYISKDAWHYISKDASLRRIVKTIKRYPACILF